MFLVGPAGAGKNTVVKITESFCCDLCRSIGVLWNDNIFLFTAYTGSADTSSRGVTICKASFIYQEGDLSQEEKL